MRIGLDIQTKSLNMIQMLTLLLNEFIDPTSAVVVACFFVSTVFPSMTLLPPPDDVVVASPLEGGDANEEGRECTVDPASAFFLRALCPQCCQ